MGSRSGWVAAAMFGIAGLLSGCSVYQDEVHGSYAEASWSQLGSGAGIPVQVDGVVGSVGGDALSKAVASAMPTTLGGSAIHYAPCEANTECAGDHVVWTFGPPAARPASAYPPALGHNLNWFGSYQPVPNNVTAKVALIQGGRVVASAAGQVDANNPDDPAFRALIGEMTHSVMPGPSWLDLPI